MTRTLELTPLQPPAEAERAALAAMTFPVYRPMLTLAPTTRHPEQGDARRVQPIGVLARFAGRPVGLVLGDAGQGSTAARAAAVEEATKRLSGRGLLQARLHAAGYDMDNMKPRGFVESEMPVRLSISMT